VATLRDIQEAADGLRGIARRTRLLYVEELAWHLKLENEQPIGAFKIRGAYNAIRKLPDPARKRGGHHVFRPATTARLWPTPRSNSACVR